MGREVELHHRSSPKGVKLSPQGHEQNPRPTPQTYMLRSAEAAEPPSADALAAQAAEAVADTAGAAPQAEARRALGQQSCQRESLATSPWQIDLAAVLAQALAEVIGTSALAPYLCRLCISVARQLARPTNQK